MAIKKLRHLPDAILKGRAKRVSVIDGSINKLIDDMIETMQLANGMGLAAPQIGVPLRVVVLQMPEEEPVALINPEVVKRSGEQEVVEGCLSIPGYAGEIKRSVSVTVKGLDRRGRATRIKASGLMAQVLQHELDHLNGILYVDHVTDETKVYRIEQKEAGGESEEVKPAT